MLVRDIMTPAPHTVSAASPVAEAVQKMREHRIRHLPVLEEGTLVGIISDRDLRWLLGQRLHAPQPGDGMADPVGEVMTGKPHTVSDTAHVLEAVDLLLDRGIGGLPVLGADGRLVGIVTYVDVLRACRSLLRDS